MGAGSIGQVPARVVAMLELQELTVLEGQCA